MSCSVCQGYDSHKCPCCGDGLEVVGCPNCNGTGNADWMVFDIKERVAVPCIESAYLYAAEDEDEAEYLGKRYCKLSCECQTCKGEGLVYQDKRDNIYPII